MAANWHFPVLIFVSLVAFIGVLRTALRRMPRRSTSCSRSFSAGRSTCPSLLSRHSASSSDRGRAWVRLEESGGLGAGDHRRKAPATRSISTLPLIRTELSRRCVLNYRFAYSIGFHPWEDAAADVPFVETALRLFAREEGDRGRPLGRALDIGTGSGIWGIELAKRGWDVVGVDFVEKALARARDRATAAQLEIELVRADVTALSRADVGSNFRLVLDTGTFHDFDEGQRTKMAQGVDDVAAEDATVLLLAWPRRRRPLIRGVSRDEIEAAFSGWRITDVAPSHFRLPKPLELLLRPDEHWYRLQRA
jgi:SAM-dependent methyltransferase